RPLGEVRLHDEAGADDAARKLDALAFTRGNDIYFRAGAYDPQSPEGQKLLAHEFAHVIRQRPGVNRHLRRKPAPGLGAQVIRRKSADKKKSKQPEVKVPDDQKGPTFTAPSGEKPQGKIDT